MQTQRDCPARLAGTQEPLLHAKQIVPGVFLTGIGFAHIWKVLEVRPDGIIIEQQNNLRNRDTRKQHIKDFLPKIPKQARTHVISINGLLEIPSAHAVYACLDTAGQLITVVAQDGKWSRTMPIVPVLYKIWEIPAVLNKLLVDKPADYETGTWTPTVLDIR